MCEIYLLFIKFINKKDTTWTYGCRSVFCIINFGQISHIFLVFPLLSLNK